MKLQGTRPKGRGSTALRYQEGDWVVFNHWSGAGLTELIGRLNDVGSLACVVVVMQNGREHYVSAHVTNIIAKIPKETALAMLELQGRLM